METEGGGNGIGTREQGANFPLHDNLIGIVDVPSAELDSTVDGVFADT